MDLLASVHMHGIQTSGNTIRKHHLRSLEGHCRGRILDTRPFAEIMRQWRRCTRSSPSCRASSRSPSTAPRRPRRHRLVRHRPRSPREDGSAGFRQRSAADWRTPVIGSVVREFLPWDQILNYVEAVIRVYNGYGRRDKKWKARIKILVKAEGQPSSTQWKRVPRHCGTGRQRTAHHHCGGTGPRAGQLCGAACCSPPAARPQREHLRPASYQRWLQQNVRGHKLAGMKAVTLSFKRGFCPRRRMRRHAGRPGPAGRAVQRWRGAHTHDQNLMLPCV